MGFGVGTGLGGIDSSTTGGEEPVEDEDDGGGVDDGDDTGDAPSDGADPLLDVGTPDVDEECDPDDVCCNPVAQPQHALLEAFLAAYPAANMPKSHDAVKNFMATADGHVIEHVSGEPEGEHVDPIHGGLTMDNMKDGLADVYERALAVAPAGAVVETRRDEPIIIDDLGGIENCNGVGWVWGSVMLRLSTHALHEMVYLYIGYCNVDEDVEAFLYSGESFEICPPPG